MNAANTAETAAADSRAIRFAILSMCRREQTEACIFGHLCERPDYRDGRHSKETVDHVIDTMLDAGELRASLMQAEGRFYPTLITIG